MDVWDIEVEEDHSYVSDGFISHNSQNPNLQQLPRDSIVKRMYTSRFLKRGCIYQADLSQIELRLLAAACGDPSMVKAYHSGLDLHSMTTSRVFKIEYDHLLKDHLVWLQHNNREKEAKQLDLQRKIGKTLNFLTGYGGGALGFQAALANQGIFLPIEECEDHLESFFDAYPSLRKYLAYYKRFIQEHAVAVSLTGRVRVFEEVYSDDKKIANKALRAGCNHLIQSTAADMMMVVLHVLESVMRAEGFESILVSTVHDSLMIDAVRDEVPLLHKIVTELLNNIPQVFEALYGDTIDQSWLNILPFGGDAEIGQNYLDLVRLTDNPDWDKVWHIIGVLSTGGVMKS